MSIKLVYLGILGEENYSRLVGAVIYSFCPILLVLAIIIGQFIENIIKPSSIKEPWITLGKTFIFQSVIDVTKGTAQLSF